jgi:Rrf2 family protein
MRISTKGRYALSLMLDLAMNDSGGPVRIKDIAARQGISDKYLEQIISSLNKAGLVRSVRGPQGGYRLARDTSQYTVGAILRLTEGPLSPVVCLEDDVNTCERQDTCATLKLWEMLDEAINNVVDSVTLADLVEWQKEKTNEKKNSQQG